MEQHIEVKWKSLVVLLVLSFTGSLVLFVVSTMFLGLLDIYDIFAFNTFLVIGAPAIGWCSLYNRKQIHPLKFNRLPPKFNFSKPWIVVLCIFILLLGASALLASFSQYLLDFLPDVLKNKVLEWEGDQDTLIQSIIDEQGIVSQIKKIVTMALFPALFEEMYFRGALLPITINITGGRRNTSIWIVAIIFSAVHFSITGFLSRLALGVGFGYLYSYGRGLKLPILAHFINNMLAIYTM